LNPKIGEPIMESLKEGVKFVFNNKTILGALSLDMIAVLLELLLCCHFCTGYFESRPTGFVLRAARLLALLMLIISAYIPLQKNAGMKLLCHFGFELHHCFGLPIFLVVRCRFIF
jgi:hypothetical protein